jgi:hypothetical protein
MRHRQYNRDRDNRDRDRGSMIETEAVQQRHCYHGGMQHHAALLDRFKHHRMGVVHNGAHRLGLVPRHELEQGRAGLLIF